MLVRHNPESFLTGDDPFLPTRTVERSADRLVEELTFEPRHEGFIGIPHGGLGMGLCLDAWRRVGQPQYPVSVRFRFGGSGMAILDSAFFAVERDGNSSEPTVVARITRKGENSPYLRAEISPASGSDDSEPHRETAWAGLSQTPLLPKLFCLRTPPKRARTSTKVQTSRISE